MRCAPWNENAMLNSACCRLSCSHSFQPCVHMRRVIVHIRLPLLTKCADTFSPGGYRPRMHMCLKCGRRSRATLLVVQSGNIRMGHEAVYAYRRGHAHMHQVLKQQRPCHRTHEVSQQQQRQQQQNIGTFAFICACKNIR